MEKFLLLFLLLISQLFHRTFLLFRFKNYNHRNKLYSVNYGKFNQLAYVSCVFNNGKIKDGNNIINIEINCNRFNVFKLLSAK